MPHNYRRALERIAALDDGLLTPFEWKAVYDTAREIARRALGYEVRHELPSLRRAPCRPDA